MKDLFLFLEDNPADAGLIARKIQQSGMEFSFDCVDNKSDFISAIGTAKYSAILADNSLPQFSATEALEIYNQKGLDIPFILVTGSISEEFAVEVMKEGAWDYVLKDRLQRLPGAIQNAIKKCTAEREKKAYLNNILANEAIQKEAERIAHFGSWEADLDSNIHRWSDELYRLQGYAPGEVEASFDNFLKNVHTDDVSYIKSVIEDTIKYKSHEKADFRIIHQDGSIKYVSAGMVVKRAEDGSAVRLNGFMRDVSEIKSAEANEKQITADLMQRNKDLEQFSYIVSHNLRAPVANIVGIANVLDDCNLSEEEHAEFRNGLVKSVKRLDEIIQDLNNILQIRTHLTEKKEKIRFSAVVDDIKTGIQNLLVDTDALIVTDFYEVDEVHSLRSYIHSIFYNLISNSIKFRQTAIPPLIHITSRCIADTIELTFKDNGIGIGLNEKGKKLFGLYNRFHPNRAEGKGVGLFMVKTQVEALAGRITVKSEVNKGSEFKIEFNRDSFTSRYS